ncbi:DUF5626 family protein [Enterococcus lemanii]|uniref:DUF5626 family protein n=1 Tax=Enterococcus lemanii TaxID=1159752 RepID=A0ABV9MU27_9ENTE|nr:DUF5626 family protein [Enterococcus lemanii]MBM7710415.1 hypothetical protein [Enterococcus lemanii]
MKKLLAVFIFMCTLMFTSMKVYAQEGYFDELNYDLNLSDNSYKSFTYTNNLGEEIILEVESIPSRERVSSGTYKVSKTSKGSWTVSYNVTINSKSQFTAATNLNLQALKGSILSSSLTHSSTKASCDFKQKAGLITSNANVTTTISNGKLIVK